MPERRHAEVALELLVRDLQERGAVDLGWPALLIPPHHAAKAMFACVPSLKERCRYSRERARQELAGSLPKLAHPAKVPPARHPRRGSGAEIAEVLEIWQNNYFILFRRFLQRQKVC